MTATIQRFETKSAGRSCTFVIRIYHTEHGTWQGQLVHVQTGQMQYFQSCLEMLKMIEAAGGLAGQEDDVANAQS